MAGRVYLKVQTSTRFGCVASVDFSTETESLASWKTIAEMVIHVNLNRAVAKMDGTQTYHLFKVYESTGSIEHLAGWEPVRI
jgi:hypothetical protein